MNETGKKKLKVPHHWTVDLTRSPVNLKCSLPDNPVSTRALKFEIPLDKTKRKLKIDHISTKQSAYIPLMKKLHFRMSYMT